MVFMQNSKLILPTHKSQRTGNHLFGLMERILLLWISRKNLYRLLFQLMLIHNLNHLSLKQMRRIQHFVVFCHNKATIRSYISWLSTGTNLTLLKPTMRYETRNYQLQWTLLHNGGILQNDLLIKSFYSVITRILPVSRMLMY